KRIFVIAVVIIIVVCNIIGFSASYKDYQRKEREQQETIHRLELKRVVFVTSGKTYIRDEDEISPEFNDKYVIMQVALYNECIDRGVQKGEKIADYTEVQAEFDDFVGGRRTLEDCKAINALFNFEHAEKCYNESRGISYDYDDYTSSVKEELKRNRESEYFSFDECSNAEMETASEIAAKKWCDYMEGK
ncbi:MAG: hypothetical protein NC309_08420, partial [Ruminococcus sp.]|nr:hypothetical protein [Ruminococcus sp.]